MDDEDDIYRSPIRDKLKMFGAAWVSALVVLVCLVAPRASFSSRASHPAPAASYVFSGNEVRSVYGEWMNTEDHARRLELRGRLRSGAPGLLGYRLEAFATLPGETQATMVALPVSGSGNGRFRYKGPAISTIRERAVIPVSLYLVAVTRGGVEARKLLGNYSLPPASERRRFGFGLNSGKIVFKTPKKSSVPVERGGADGATEAEPNRSEGQEADSPGRGSRRGGRKKNPIRKGTLTEW